jgi:hypothetical protein
MPLRPLFCALLVVLVSAACSSGDSSSDATPRLVRDVTLGPTVPVPTRFLTPTPPPVTEEGSNPFELITASAAATTSGETNFSGATPTLAPSKTPTLTPTVTVTATQTPRPTRTSTPISQFAPPPTQLPPPHPTAAPAQVIANAPPATCTETPWFFADPAPSDCPLNPPLVTQGTYLQLQNGFMIWVQQQDAIYVLYISGHEPRWQVYNDAFEEGMPETDTSLDGGAPPFTFQPRRGIGLVWRSFPEVRRRLGWAVRQYEEVYTIQVQIGVDGTIYLQAPDGGVFELTAGGQDWQRYEGAGAF